MCRNSRQRGWVGAGPGRSPACQTWNGGVGGAKERRHTSDWSLYVSGRRLTNKKTQGAAVPPWKDQRELGHLRFYSVSNCLALFGPAVLGELERPAGSPVCVLAYSTSRTEISVCMSLCSFLSHLIFAQVLFPRFAWTPWLYVSFARPLLWARSKAANKSAHHYNSFVNHKSFHLLRHR